MKKHILHAASLTIFWTAAAPVWAQSSASLGTSSTAIESVVPERLSDYGMRLNTQLGSSSFETTGANKKSGSGLSGGLTVEFGKSVRKFETGLIYMEMARSGFLTVPMNAKIRLVSMRAQSWYLKAGFAPAFETANRQAQASNLDVLAGLGIGGRAMINEKTDLILDATYHRGLLNADVNSPAYGVFNQGLLLLAGLSVRI